jgi:hypothetical protein
VSRRVDSLPLLAGALLAWGWGRVLAELPTASRSYRHIRIDRRVLVVVGTTAAIPSVLLVIGAVILVVRPHRALAGAYAVSAALDTVAIALGLLGLIGKSSYIPVARYGWNLAGAGVAAAASTVVAWRVTRDDSTRYDSSEPDLNR